LINAAAMLGVGVLQRGIGLVLITILSRILEPKGLGAFTFVQSTSNSFAGMSRLGVDIGLHVRLAGFELPGEASKAEALLGEALTLTLLSCVGVALGMALFADEIAEVLFAAPALGPLVMVSAVLLVAQMMIQYCYAVFAGFHSFTIYSRIAVITQFGSAVLAVAGASTWGAWGCAIGFASGQAIAVLLMANSLRKVALLNGVRLHPCWPASEARTVLALGFPFYAGVALVVPAEFVSLGLLSNSSGLAALGELRVTQALMSLAALVPGAITGPLLSHLAGPSAGGDAKASVLVQLKLSWILGLAIAAGLALVWPDAVAIIFGGDYSYAGKYGVLALVGFVPSMLVTVMTAAVLVRRESLVLAAVGAVQAIVLIGSAAFLIPAFGFAGFLAAKAFEVSTASVCLLIYLVRLHGRSFLRPWMIYFAFFTLATLASAIGSVVLEVGIGIRAGITLAAVLAAIPTVWLALDPLERHRVRYAVAKLLAKTSSGAGFKSSPLKRKSQ